MKACWMVCLVTALSATSAWAESPLQSLQFEQQKQQVLKAVKENARQQATSAITILPIKCWRPTVTRTRSAKQRWRKSAITKKATRPQSTKSSVRPNSGYFSLATSVFQSNGVSCL